MELNADYNQRVVHGDELAWQNSPIAGIDRKMFDRIGDEVARTTSIVRYGPGSHFSPHVHTGGEELIVLDGVVQDEHGDFPAGSYIRNPPESKHTPGSAPSCVIFVKLWQFDLEDRTRVRLNMRKMRATPAFDRPGVSVISLYHDEREDVRLKIWQPGTEIHLDAGKGAELPVLEGSFEEGGDNLRGQSWLRAPIESNVEARVGPTGARVWIKTGHLRFVNPPISQSGDKRAR